MIPTPRGGLLHRPARGAGLLAAFALAAAGAAYAQCPDGTPPPCGAARAAAAPRRINPPLDGRTWIVLPFDNTARAAEVEWLRDASVELLYLDLSRWNDIRVVDAKRVADFMREVPSAAAAQKLSLNEAVAVARRAGAGNLVMGDVLKLGNRTSITATLFDVRKGERVRSVREEATVQDSILPLFGRLATGILRVAPASGGTGGTVGTSRIDAYQEYLAGVQALNQFDVTEAKQRFERAVSLDTAFALAHYQWAIASTYDEAAANARVAKLDLADVSNAVAAMTEDSARTRHATAAARLSGSLPPRERALIAGLLAHIRHDYGRACDTYATLVRADSSDVEALYGLGECLYKDDVLVPVGGDTTRLRFRSSWNTSLRVLRRAVAVDPTFHLAFSDLLAILSSSARVGCRRDDQAPACVAGSAAATGGSVYLGTITRDADSLLIVPVRATTAEAALAQTGQMDRSGTRRRNLEEARAAALEWVAAGPTEGRAHKALARILLRLGQLPEAEAQLAEISGGRGAADENEVAQIRLELALKTWRGGEVVRLLDSLGRAWTDPIPHITIALFQPVSGRLFEADTILRAVFRKTGTSVPQVLVDYFIRSQRMVLGTAGESDVAAEQAMILLLQPKGVCAAQCASFLSPSWTFGLRVKRSPWPQFDSTARGLRMAPAAAASRGDTAGLRRAAVALDSASRAGVRVGATEDGTGVLAADAFLLLGDSATALKIVTRITDSTLRVTPMESPLGIGITVAAVLWPRMILARADLEAGMGHREEARVWYRRFVDLWSKADPEFQPVLDRARKAALP